MLSNNILSSITGTVSSDAVIVEVNGKEYKSITVIAKRLGGYEDEVEVLVDINQQPFDTGTRVRVVGFLFAYYLDGHIRVCLYSLGIIRVKTLNDKNLIMCAGTVTRPPVLRKSPAGKTICELMIAVNNELNEMHSSYIPCIAWNNVAESASNLPIGTKILIAGRLQSRKYVKQFSDTESETRTAKELSVNSFNLLTEV